MNIDFSQSFISKERQLELKNKIKKDHVAKKVYSYFPSKSFGKLHFTELFIIIEHFIDSVNKSSSIEFCPPIYHLNDISLEQDFVLNFGMFPLEERKNSVDFSQLKNHLWLKKHELQNQFMENQKLEFDLYGFSPFLLANATNINSVETDLFLEKISSLISILTERNS